MCWCMTVTTDGLRRQTTDHSLSYLVILSQKEKEKKKREKATKWMRDTF